jgi:hypothetical protein
MGSMQRYVPDVDYHVLATRNTAFPFNTINNVREQFSVVIHSLSCLLENEDDVTCQIVAKYNNDQLRWSLKPCWLEYLLQFYEKVIYVDNDCYFVNDFKFLLDELNHHGILLTPHWRLMTPSTEFSYNLSDGIFNAGFVGVSKDAKPMLEWWKSLCEWKCSFSPDYGFFVDQKYLDLVPVLFEDTYKTIQHRGCNVASWNALENERVEQPDGSILIKDKWPVIFVHLSHWKRDEQFLEKYAKMYRNEAETYRRWLYDTQNRYDGVHSKCEPHRPGLAGVMGFTQ